MTDFPHVRALFVDAWTRLVAMKLFARRAADYMRAASPQDRRYLLYNPMVKMKVTTQGEEVINLLWDVIAAKGFEKDMYFDMAARDIRALPKLEGTVHVNMALIVKFMANYFSNPAPFPPAPRRDEAAHDDFLFRQGPTKGLGRIQFHDYHLAYDGVELPNVRIFREQIELLKQFGLQAGPDGAQQKDVDFLLSLGELFTLVAYGQLLLEAAPLDGVDGRRRGPDLRLHGARLLEVRAAALLEAERDRRAAGAVPADDPPPGRRRRPLRPRLDEPRPLPARRLRDEAVAPAGSTVGEAGSGKAAGPASFAVFDGLRE